MRGAASESVSAHARYSGYRAPAQYIKHNKNMTNSQKGTTIMKRIISILSVMMALLCVLTLASCADLLSTTKFERGTRTDEAYTNTSAGLAFVKPSGWVFYTDDQLEQTFKVSKDLLKDPDAMDKADVSSLYEFMAVDSSTGNNVNLVVAKGNGVTSVEKYVEQVKKELSDQLTSGMTVTFGEGTSNVKLGDGTWVTYSAQVSTNGVNMTQYYFARKVGKYFLQITATDVSGIGQAAFEKMFTVPSAETGTAS